MGTIIINISRIDVFNDVAKTASYTGAKMVGDDDAYERISITDQNMELFNSYWNVAVSLLCDNLKEMIQTITHTSEGLKISLNVSNSFDISLVSSINASIKAFFVEIILGKWFEITNKQEFQARYNSGVEMLTDALRKLYYRKAPTRPVRLQNE